MHERRLNTESKRPWMILWNKLEMTGCLFRCLRNGKASSRGQWVHSGQTWIDSWQLKKKSLLLISSKSAWALLNPSNLSSNVVSTASTCPRMDRLTNFLSTISWSYACGAYMFCRSPTCVFPRQRGRQEPQLQCRQYQTAGSSAHCCRCCLIPAPG